MGQTITATLGQDARSVPLGSIFLTAEGEESNTSGVFITPPYLTSLPRPIILIRSSADLHDSIDDCVDGIATWIAPDQPTFYHMVDQLGISPVSVCERVAKRRDEKVHYFSHRWRHFPCDLLRSS